MQHVIPSKGDVAHWLTNLLSHNTENTVKIAASATRQQRHHSMRTGERSVAKAPAAPCYLVHFYSLFFVVCYIPI